MKTISLHGYFDTFFQEQTLFPSRFETVSENAISCFGFGFDIPATYRKAIYGDFEALRYDHHTKVMSRFNVPEVFGTYFSCHFDTRPWAFQEVLWNRFGVREYMKACFRWSPLDEVDAVRWDRPVRNGIYGLGIRGLHDLKCRYRLPRRASFDSVLIGGNAGYRGAFSISRSNLRATFPLIFDSYRTWTVERVPGFHDRCYLGRLWCPVFVNAVYDPEQWPNRFMDRYSAIIENPRKWVDLYAANHATVDSLPRDRCLYSFDAFLYYFDGYPTARQAFVRPGWRILAKNLETEESFDLGFIDADAEDKSLSVHTDKSLLFYDQRPAEADYFAGAGAPICGQAARLPDGDYEITVLTSSLFWKDAMDGNVRTISVRPGDEISPLPVIYNLRSATANGTTTVYWSASKSEIEECLFGIWYSSEPFFEEATNGSDDSSTSGSSIRPPGRGPDATVWYSSTMTEYQNSFAQNAPAWVAVAAMRPGETETGKVHQLYLDWSNVPPRAPDDVVILDEPLPVFDADVLERPLEDVDLALVF